MIQSRWRFCATLPSRWAATSSCLPLAAARGLWKDRWRRLAGFGTRQVGHPEVLSLNAILRRMSKLIASVAAGRIEIVMHPDRMAGKIHADDAQIEQLVMSLVMHACAAMPEGGRLLIETGEAEI